MGDVVADAKVLLHGSRGSADTAVPYSVVQVEVVVCPWYGFRWTLV